MPLPYPELTFRSDYERRLGQSPYDLEEVDYTVKVERLKLIYDGDMKAQIADPVMYSLLNARAVREFNGQRWFGIHPLVVDILVRQSVIVPGANRRVAGGTI